MLTLPDAQEVSHNVAAWSAANPALASLLAARLTVDQALARWGLRLLKEQHLPAATAAFRSALALKPADAVLWINCGVSLDQSGAFPEAAECFEKSLALSPAQPDAWLLLGLTRKRQGDFTAAEAAYRRTLELDPALPVAWQCLGLLKEEQKDYVGAIDAFTNCIKHGGSSAPLIANIGKLSFQIGRFLEAHDAFQKAVSLDAANSHYREMLRKTGLVRDVLQNVSLENATAAYRASFHPPEIFAEPDFIEFWDKATILLGGFGHVDSALRLGRQRSKNWPANHTVEYILQAMEGNRGLERSPTSFIVQHFDASAESFDSRLVNDLGYDIPAKLLTAIRAITPAGHLYDALDAGCGTGLCGPLLRPIARTLVGVDLSPKMLEQVAKRGLYDKLACEELTSFLDHSPAQFDLVVATDVLIYFGELLPFFTSAANAIPAGGLLAFSTQSGPETGYRLLPSGHFAHAPDYVQTMAHAYFTQELCAETTIRFEATRRLNGHLFLFRRKV